MSKIKTISRIWKTNKRDLIVPIFNKFVKLGFFNSLDDNSFLSIAYKVRFGKQLDIQNPKTFNEKLNWLKIYDRKVLYSKMVDKYEAKRIVCNKIGSEYIIPTIGVYNDFEEIDTEALPDRFVIKCTHDSGSVMICKRKENFNLKKCKRRIERAQKRNLYYWAREWPYKIVQPRIIVEKYIESLESNLVVYKVFCFHGKPRIIQVVQNDKTDYESIDYFDTEWNLLNISQDYPNSKKHINKPDKLEEMLELSGQFLSERAFIRVDWYIVNNELLFSEFTFFSDAGLARFNPPEWDYKLGELMELGL